LPNSKKTASAPLVNLLYIWSHDWSNFSWSRSSTKQAQKDRRQEWRGKLLTLTGPQAPRARDPLPAAHTRASADFFLTKHLSLLGLVYLKEFTQKITVSQSLFTKRQTCTSSGRWQRPVDGLRVELAPIYSFLDGPSPMGWHGHGPRKHGPSTARPDYIRARAWHGRPRVRAWAAYSAHGPARGTTRKWTWPATGTTFCQQPSDPNPRSFSAVGFRVRDEVYISRCRLPSEP
jgi:hypothetical protein